jgi:hypothetical protein
MRPKGGAIQLETIPVEEHARKRSPQINVELVVGPEVFEQHADGIASQQQRTGHDAGYYIWVTENGYDLMCRAGVDRRLPQRGWCTIHQLKHSSGTTEQSLRRWATRSPDPWLLPFLLRWRCASIFFLIFCHERTSGVFTR